VGGEDAIKARVQAHHDAGADQVAVQVVPADPAPDAVPMAEWHRLAAALL